MILHREELGCNLDDGVEMYHADAKVALTCLSMPKYALVGHVWLGRLPVALQNGPLGLRMLLGLGRP